MLLSSRSMNLGKDALTNSVGDVVPNVGSPLQAASPLLARGDTDMLIKVLLFTINWDTSANIVVPTFVVVVFFPLPASRCSYIRIIINSWSFYVLSFWLFIYLFIFYLFPVVKNGSVTTATAATEQ